MKIIKHTIPLIIASAVASLLFGCATTEQSDVKQLSGFLGDYSMLKPGGDDRAAFVYIDPAANFSAFHSVYIAPVEIWAATDQDSSFDKLSGEEKQLLVDYLHASLEEKLSSDYRLVEQPGQGVLVVRAAITEASKSKRVMDTMSTVVPIGMGISYTKKLVSGTHAAVGDVGVEVALADGGTGERMAAAVDRRAGKKSIDGVLDTWGDVKDSFDFWARKLQTRLAELKYKS